METLKAIMTRKSTRVFTMRQVEDDRIDKIVSAGIAAPAGAGGYANLHITIVQDQEIFRKIVAEGAKISGDPSKNPTFGAPTLIVVSGKKGRLIEADIENTASVGVTMTLAATDLGVDNIFLMGVASVFKMVPDLVAALQLPDEFFPINAVALGYAEEPDYSERVYEQKINVTRL
jgi:nitroreductase